MTAPLKPDFEKIKRGRQRDGNIGQETMNQVTHVRSAGAALCMSEVLVPGNVITADISAAAVLVRAGALCRIKVSDDTYVAFGDVALGAVSSTSTPALLLPAGIWLVAATEDWIRASAAVDRLEVITQGGATNDVI